jgi:hypothetical protein
MTKFYVKKMVCVSTVVEADDEEAAEQLAETIPVEVVGWDYEWDEVNEVEEAATEE